MLPTMKCSVTVPANLMGMAARHHNKCIKTALRSVLVEHHRKRIPLHFQSSNRAKYGHMPRKPGYMRVKMRRYKSRTDLVKTGKTRNKFLLNADIRIGGSASGSKTSAPGVRGQLIMRFPFPANYDPPKARVNAAQMIKEISSWTDSEANEASQAFLDKYTQAVKDLIANSPRLRISPQGGTP